MGRPTKLKGDALHAKIVSLYKGGAIDEEVAKVIGVSIRSMYRWKRKFPEFCHALKEAKSGPDDSVEISLLQNAQGYWIEEEMVAFSFGKFYRTTRKKWVPGNPTAQIFWLKNRRPESWRDQSFHVEQSPHSSTPKGKVDFQTFCANAGYPVPYAKQVEMRDFALKSESTTPRLILGSRGYGKTDYITILGLAYEIYLDPEGFTSLIVTKSDKRNSAILREIASALQKNGLTLEKNNSDCVRVAGLIGKDGSAEALTLKSCSMRGRHPKVVVMDDPVTPEDVSEATRAQAERAYNEIVKLTQNVVVIGQPVHQYDLFEKLRPMIQKMEVPYGSIPELDVDLKAMELAGVDVESISASYFLKVVTQGTTPFDQLKSCDEFGPGDCVAFIDPSHEGGDYTAMSIIKGYMDGVKVVGFVWKRAWNHCLEAVAGKPGIMDRLKQFGVRRVAFECNALGDQPVLMMQELLVSMKLDMGVIGRRSTNNKHSRIMAAGQYAGVIHLSKESDRIYSEQVVKYEYKAKHDDAPDSLATGLEWIGLIRGKV